MTDTKPCPEGYCTPCDKRRLSNSKYSNDDPFDFVEPCEPDCTPERHAYHQGQWDMASRMVENFKDCTCQFYRKNCIICTANLKALIGGDDE